MSYKPAVPVPVEEQPILEKLIGIRQRLAVLKRDRTRYIDKNDVFNLYNQLVEQLELIDKRRTSDKIRNIVDTQLEDCLHLLSLFYLAIGRNNDLPAFFVQLGTVRRLLEYSLEGACYTQNDLKPLKERLERIRTAILEGAQKEEASPVVVKYLKNKLEQCDKNYSEAQSNISKIAPELTAVQTRLVSIRRQIDGFAVRPTNDGDFIDHLMKQLKEIEEMRDSDGKFVDDQGQPLQGQELCNGILEECFSFLEDAKSKQGLSDEMKSSPRFQQIYCRLDELLNKLKHLTLTHRWTLRETDLYVYRASLAEIDSMRSDGQFLDENGNAPAGQRILLYLLRRCYAYIYQLLSASEPVSEELMTVHNQLRTVKRCLQEVQRSGGIYSERDLYPYQMKLASLEKLRVNGYFLASDNSIPEGQELVNSLLTQCHQLIEEIRDEKHQHDIEEDEAITRTSESS
ncbi:uncharacterized protein SOCG_00868 [Schizosaccharomyces octosporus yFS286]|uniref:Fungal protein n=1 Tax=Schizosaccharomyces octosporus (strain yFS286) TaxID=483514 RepID=S9PYS2_SCHOY|nr:uncharacterized protein SOCG_00868 [Schizosaccharomyces octosporus yFS286]EPX73112.1 fungal protein [Schizosaccharomyces octosporus yFS286]